MNATRRDTITRMIVQISSNPASFPANSGGAPRNANLSVQTGEAIYSRLNARNSRISNRFDRVDGVYLWMIMVNTANNTPQVRFVKTNPYFEYGSKHFMLRNRSPGMVVLGAGELQIAGGMVRFNLQSGTYQKPILQGLQAMGISEQEIAMYYNWLVKNSFGAQDAEILLPYTTPIVDHILIQRFTRANLNAAGIVYQDIKYSTTQWLKQLITSVQGWPAGIEIGKKVGKKSLTGVVFQVATRKDLLVKVTLLPFRINGNPAIELHQNEVRGYKEALRVGATAVRIEGDFMIQAPVDPRLGEIYTMYAPGSSPMLSVIIMTNYFYPKAQFSSMGDLFDLVQRDPVSIPTICKQIRLMLRRLHLDGATRHGDLHPGNILYRRRIGGGYEISFIDFGNSYEDHTMSDEAIYTSGNRTMNVGTNLNGRVIPKPTYANRTMGTAHASRVPNAWYMEHFYNR